MEEGGHLLPLPQSPKGERSTAGSRAPGGVGGGGVNQAESQAPHPGGALGPRHPLASDVPQD